MLSRVYLDLIERMADSGVRDQEFLNDHQWIAAWKLPDRNEQTNTGEALTSEPKPRQRIATYDSAIEVRAFGDDFPATSQGNNYGS